MRSTFNGRSGGIPPLESLDLPRRKSLKEEEEAGERPLTTAKLSRVGLLPNLSRMLEHDRKRSESATAPVRLIDVFARLYVCRCGLPGAMTPLVPDILILDDSKVTGMCSCVYVTAS